MPKRLFTLSAFLCIQLNPSLFYWAAYGFAIFSRYKDFLLALSLTLGSRFLVIISAGSRTPRRSFLRSNISPATLTTNTFSMWQMKPRSMTLWMPWVIASSLWKVCGWMKNVEKEPLLLQTTWFISKNVFLNNSSSFIWRCHMMQEKKHP